MKKYLVLLSLIIVCPVLFYGQSATPIQPAEWSLSLKTGGPPWYKSFEVKLSQGGKLVVTEQNPEKMPAETRSKLTVSLSTKDAQEIYEHALKAFREFRFPEEKVERRDGTSLILRLTTHHRSLEMGFSHIGLLEEECPEVDKVLSLINKHLPKEHQVY